MKEKKLILTLKEIMEKIVEFFEILWRQKKSNNKEVNDNIMKISESIKDIKDEIKELKTLFNKEIKDANKKAEKYKDTLKESDIEIKNSKKAIEELKGKNNDCKKENAELQKTLNEREEELNVIKEKISDKENELQESNKKIEEITDIKIKVENELKEYKQYFTFGKKITLLDKIIINPVLKNFREKHNLDDLSVKNIALLTKYLCTPGLFLDFILEEIVEFKKENQDEMLDEEVEFYKAVNDYFDKEVFVSPDVKRTNDSFDKEKHRGPNNETKGEIEDGIILIPKNIKQPRIRVKLKSK